ncbi:MAG: hypothetical protein QOE90_178 [Thermoplasmata archaeon]|jgi:hypothetical protein|nr:hypothetical protein [Thermoplasmata archaeon]
MKFLHLAIIACALALIIPLAPTASASSIDGGIDPLCVLDNGILTCAADYQSYIDCEVIQRVITVCHPI